MTPDVTATPQVLLLTIAWASEPGPDDGEVRHREPPWDLSMEPMRYVPWRGVAVGEGKGHEELWLKYFLEFWEMFDIS